jgi:rubrerythrin
MPEKFSKFSSLLDKSLSGSWWNGEKRKKNLHHAKMALDNKTPARKSFYERALLSMHWRKVVGKAAKFCCPLKVQDDILYVACAAPVWAQELTLQQAAILEKLNSKLKNASLKKIVCVHKKSGILRDNAAEVTKPARNKQESIDASPEEKAEIDKSSSIIEDATLRNIISLARAAQKQDEKWNKNHNIFICPKCGRADKAGYCPACRRAEYQSRISEIFRALGTAPWLSCDETAKIVPGITFDEYSQCRKQLLSSLWEDIWKHMAALAPGSPLPAKLRANIITLALMQAKVTPDKITEAILKGSFKALELNTYNLQTQDAYQRLQRLMEKYPEKTKHVQLLKAYLNKKACEPAKPFILSSAN